MTNMILNSDSYKASHFLQYPPGTEQVSSYIESRGGAYDKVVLFGLQGFIKDYLLKPITAADIDQAEKVLSKHGLPFNRSGWEHILNEHKGLLPLKIEAAQEGSIIDNKNVLVQVTNTDPKCFWLTSYIETALLRAVWYPTTVATVSHHVKDTIRTYLLETAGHTDGLEFKLHDFGARGVSSLESASIGGAAHLVNFRGTDTLTGLMYLIEFYNAEMPGFSIPAAEHSTITSWGREREVDAYENMLKQFAGEGKLVAVVSDSYDLYNAIDTMWGGKLKQQVINNGGTVVIRPDSGDPVEVVCETLRRIERAFGVSINARGYKVLPEYIRVIQGDGVNPESIKAILQAMKVRGYSAENIAFGMGGKLLQCVDRDTLKFAMKASAISINGSWSDVYKDPATDPGKGSKRGRLALAKTSSGTYQTVRLEELGERENQLFTVYEDGKLLIDEAFQSIVDRAERAALERFRAA